jgi:fructokinase
MSKQILCIGEALIDMICTDKGKSLSEGENFLKKTGGAPTNVAAAIAALGGNVSLAAKVGKDPFGRQLISVMKEFGVETSCMLEDPLHFTTMAFVSLLENGERDFVFSRGADGELSQADMDGLNFDDFSIIHFGSATGFLPGPLQFAYLSALNKAVLNKIFISFDPNYRHLLFKDNDQSFIDQSWYFLQHCNFFKVSDEEALLLTGKTILEEAVKMFEEKTTAAFAITLGAKGTLFGYNNTTVIVPSIAVSPVDTTGAGDAFVGALLAQLANIPDRDLTKLDAETWINLIAKANKAGARTCEYMGAMEAFKHLSSDIFN